MAETKTQVVFPPFSIEPDALSALQGDLGTHYDISSDSYGIRISLTSDTDDALTLARNVLDALNNWLWEPPHTLTVISSQKKPEDDFYPSKR